MRRLLAIGAVLLLAAIGLVGAVLAVGLSLSAPRQAAIGPAPASLPGAEPVAFPSASGTEVHGWWVPAAARGGGAVILVHGVGGNRLGMARRAAVLHGHGYGVLLFDLSAHGESRGSRITFGRNEGQDAAAAVAWVRAHAPGERIGIVGVSLGGAAAVLSPHPLDVQALVLESVFPDIGAALANRLRVALGPILGRAAVPVLVPVFMALMPPVLGVTPTDLRPIDGIARVQAPVLVASGTADPFTPLSEAQALFAAAPQPKKFWPVQGAAHEDLEAFDPPAYWSVVTPFLGAALRPAPN